MAGMEFSKHSDSEARIWSAIAAIKALLPPLELYPAHRRELISLALGKLTEADEVSKYGHSIPFASVLEGAGEGSPT